MATLSIEPNERITFGVRYEDDELAIVEKPGRVVTNPGKGHEKDSLLNGLFARWGPVLQNMGKAREFGLLHRLDRETSGLVIVAFRPGAYDNLRAQFDERSIEKYYWAITAKTPNEPTGVLRKSIIEEEVRQSKYAVKKLARISRDGRPALTAYRVLESSDLGALLECRAVTGRLHQVRVHLNSIGCAIVGDREYGSRLVRQGAPRLALHAHRLVLKHPTTGEPLDVRSQFPRDLRSTLRRLGLSLPEMGESSPT